MNISDDLVTSRSSKAVLFVGSGFSLGSMVGTEKIFDSSRLAEALTKAALFDGTLPLDKSADLFTIRKGEYFLGQSLKQWFTVTTAAPHIASIVQYPWSIIYTTNYDDSIEVAAERAGIVPNAHIPADPIRSLSTTALNIVHLNGFVRRIDQHFTSRQIKLTTTSYLSDNFIDTPWRTRFRQDLDTAHKIYFAGYSLYDLDIARLLYTAEDIRSKTHIVISNESPDYSKELLAPYGEIHAIGSVAFGVEVQTALAVAVSKSEHYFTTFTKLIPTVSTEPTNDKDVFNFYFYGSRFEEMTARGLGASPPWIVHRSCVADILALAPTVGASILTITSSVGNGKSVIAQDVGHKFAVDGWDVYILDRTTNAAYEEVRFLKEAKRPLMVIVENLFANSDILGYLRSELPNAIIVTTAKAALLDLRKENLSSKFDIELFEYDVDRLTRTDANYLSSIFYDYGFWGAHRARNVDQGTDFILNECHSQIREFLLSVLKSDHIQKKIKDDLGIDTLSRDELAILVTILILNRIDYIPDTLLIVELTGLHPAKTFSSAAGKMDLLRPYKGQFEVRSSILADWLLREMISGDLVVDRLIGIQERLGSASFSDIMFRNMSVLLTRFSVVEGILPEEKRREHLVRYYEALKTLPRFKDNELFWLQYAIARISIKDFGMAKIYFENAYKISKARKFDTRQIDNHYARFLLERSISLPDNSDSMSNLRDAFDILTRQMRTEKRKLLSIQNCRQSD